jgi:hypothetical protein
MRQDGARAKADQLEKLMVKIGIFRYRLYML